MNKCSYLAIMCVTMAVGAVNAQNSNQGAAGGYPVAPINEKFRPLPFAEVKPTGWLKRQLEDNIKGFTGHLDKLVPDLIANDDIYGANRLTKQVKSKDVGAISEDGDWQVQFLWWNSETQSNWWDGYIRTAILLNDEIHLKRIKLYINKILATQDSDGYLGIYDKDLRYRFDNENGELWAKATLLRGLLAWYDYSKDAQVLDAVKRAVDNTMQGFPIGKSTPFYSKNPSTSGLSHGLMITDVLEQLWRITGNEHYLQYIAFLYDDFSSHNLDEDGQLQKAASPNIPLKGHGVHTYEQLRALTAAYYATGQANLRQALASYEQKIAQNITPSGAPIGDEFIGGRTADATATGYEYCSIHELMDSYISLLAKTSNAKYADNVERIYFNAAQGARHPHESAICYLKTDNSYELTGGRNGDTTDRFQTRYRYSPVHKEAAVCCIPNAGRIGPYYIQNMWMRQHDTLVATLLGPNRLTTTIAGTGVVIDEQTSYPEQNSIVFKIKAAAPAPFTLKVRKPSWAASVKSSMPYRQEGDYLVYAQRWEGQQSLKISFEAKVVEHATSTNEAFFTYGALLLARPIGSTQEVKKDFGFGGFRELTVTPTSRVVLTKTDAEVVRSSPNKLEFSTLLFNPQTKEKERVALVPLKGTVLRQVTFKKE